MDQPLFALGKQIQWEWSHLGEDCFVVMMGPLHIEMMFLKLIGNWVDGSGWSQVISDSGISSTGRAEALTSVHSVTRARYAHQVKLTISQDQSWCYLRILKW